MDGEEVMATMNFSVPEDVKRKFDKAFAGKNKSRVIADLMTQAVEEQHVQKRRSKAIDALLARRRTKRPVTAKQLRRAREAGRP
jgi:metal-responsive CopG/Arc/MetJ family transcriptional regulator